MPTASQMFVADPIGFMKSHLVMVDYAGMVAGHQRLRLVLDPAKTCRTKLGKMAGKKDIRVYKLVHTTGPDHISCYWLPYDNNRLFHAQLAHVRRFLFTPIMDGCSFAYGGQDPRGAPLVCHANFQDGTGQIDPGRIRSQLGWAYGTDKRTTLDKDAYTSSRHFASGSGAVKSTTFGVSDGTRWKFYHQKWESDHRFDKVALIGMDPTTYPGGYGAWDTAYTRASTSFELLGVHSI